MMKKMLLLGLVLGSTCLAWPQESTKAKRVDDVIYGRKFGTALTLDVFQPPKPNGVGIIFVLSGGWVSKHDMMAPEAYRPFLDRGYIVFAVVHGCQPKFTIPEMIQDMQRAVRFIRHNAGTYGIDPDRLGVCGASAGGHLSLILGTKGADGVVDAKDPVDRESSRVQCVACFFPPTDFLNYGGPHQDGTGVGLLKDLKPAFGPQADTPEGRQKLGREISPIYFVSSNLPPTLIIHGTADRLVPFQQAESFVQRAKEAGATVELVAREGKGHGWPNWPAELSVCAEWFDKCLRSGVGK